MVSPRDINVLIFTRVIHMSGNQWNSLKSQINFVIWTHRGTGELALSTENPPKKVGLDEFYKFYSMISDLWKNLAMLSYVDMIQLNFH